ncbi:two-component system response regulator [Actinoplanes sp. NPDC049681]|uniref:two-component system response regulator n=1 Tax=Actinoplanes sp. NPDC049681 TaxID=3363905 RepID=UPI00379AD3B2
MVIADDDPDVADLVAYAFAGAGHTVRAVLDGARALEVIKDLRPDIAVLDHTMPNLTGSDVVEALRAYPPTRHTIIVMITGSSPHDITAPVDRLLQKPVSPRQLTAVVAEMLA